MNNNAIIIVEDDEDECNFLKTAITDNGIRNEFICFNNPVDALSYLRSTNKQTSIIISDINMPYMNGISFRNAINEDAYLNKQKIPFVFLSGFIDDIDTSLKLSVAACIKKPNTVRGYYMVAKTISEIGNRVLLD